MADATEPPRFEADLTELEATVRGLEGGELGLDAALAAYERGVGLLGRCHKRLDEAERRIALLTGVDESGGPRTAPFDASATIDGSPMAAPKKTPAGDLDNLPF